MAVVIRDGRVLIQKRYRRSKGMVYEFPGGSVDENESGTEAAIRELQEETGIENTEYIAIHSSINDFGAAIHYVLLSVPDGVEPQPIDIERQQSFYWLKRSEIPLSDFFEADLKFINKHLKTYT